MIRHDDDEIWDTMRYDEIRWRAEMIRYEYEAKIWYGKMVVFRIQAICTDCHIGITLCWGSYPGWGQVQQIGQSAVGTKKGLPWEWGWPQCKRPVVFAIIRCACHCSAQCAQTIQNSSWYIWPIFLSTLLLMKWWPNEAGSVIDQDQCLCVCVSKLINYVEWSSEGKNWNVLV